MKPRSSLQSDGTAIGPASLASIVLFVSPLAHAAQITLLTDNFTATGNPDTNNVNYNVTNRQTGSEATENWSETGNVQVGNATSITNKPAGGDYLLLASGGKAQLSALPINGTVAPKSFSVSFDAYAQNPDDTGWVSFVMGADTNLASNSTTLVNGSSTPFGFLYRENGGIALFNNGSNFAGFANGAYTQDGYNWKFTFTDDAATGSAYSGTTKVLVQNGSTTVGTWSLATDFSTVASQYVTFGSLSNGSQSSIGGIDNLNITKQVNGYTANTVTNESFQNINYDSASIFEWDLKANKDGDATDGGDTGTRGTDYDAVSVTGPLTISSSAIFKVIQNSGLDFADPFWDTNQKWDDIFTSGSLNGGWSADTAVSVYNTSGVLQDVSSYGSFTITGTTLTWTAVPEPTSALAGLLITAGLLRRRRC